MNKFLILFLIICFQNVNSQSNLIQQNIEFNIQTKFKQYGILYENSRSDSSIRAQFNKGQKCSVLNYLGDNIFKVEYKKWVGFVTSEYLVLNNELEDIMRNFEEKKNIVSKNENSETLVQEKNPIENGLIQEENIEKNVSDENNVRINDSISQAERSTNCSYQMNEIDDFYNVKIVKTENYRINDSLNIELYRNGNNKYVFIHFNGDLGCASYLSNNRSYAKIKLENNEIVTIYHSWNVDCDKFNLMGTISDSSISKLKNSPLISIRLQGTKNHIDIKNLDYKMFFMDKLDCLN